MNKSNPLSTADISLFGTEEEVCYESCLSTLNVETLKFNRLPAGWLLPVALICELLVVLVVCQLLADLASESISKRWSEYDLAWFISFVLCVFIYRQAVYFVSKNISPPCRWLESLLPSVSWKKQARSAYQDAAEEVMLVSERVSFFGAVEALIAYEPKLAAIEYQNYAAIQKCGDLWEFMWDEVDAVYVSAPRVKRLAEFVLLLTSAEELRDRTLSSGPFSASKLP